MCWWFFHNPINRISVICSGGTILVITITFVFYTTVAEPNDVLKLSSCWNVVIHWISGPLSCYKCLRWRPEVQHQLNIVHLHRLIILTCSFFRPSTMKIYNCTTGELNRLTWGQVERASYEYMMKNPLDDIIRIPNPRFTSNRSVILSEGLTPLIIYILWALKYFVKKKFETCEL